MSTRWNIQPTSPALVKAIVNDKGNGMSLTISPFPDTEILSTDLLGELECYSEAEMTLREIAAIQRRTLGTEHRETLNTRHGVALMLLDQGRYQEAEDELREVAATRTRALGPEDPTTQRTREAI